MLSREHHAGAKTGWVVAAVLFMAFLVVMGISEYGSGGAGSAPAANADVSLYKASVRGEITQLQASMTTFTALTNNSRVTDPAWRGQLDAQFNVWHQVYAEAQSLHPPVCLTDAHQKWLAALHQIDRAATDGSLGEANLDAKLILQATNELNTGTSLLSDANTTVRAAQC